MSDWLDDPTGIYDHRYWDGQGWTEYVSRHGSQLVDHVTDFTTLQLPAQSDFDPSPQAPPPPPPPAAAEWQLPDAGWLPDPAGHYRARWWDGDQWTAWVATDAGAEPDRETSLDHMQPPTPVGHLPAVDRPTVGSRARDVAVRATGGEDKKLGDRVVHSLGAVTLNNWANRRMSEAFFVPQLAEAVRRQPNEPLPLLHLGLRLVEMQTANDRIRKAMAYSSPTQFVTRPVTRAVGRTVTNSLKSDTTPAHEKVLRPLHHHLVERVQRHPRDPVGLNALARIYRATGHTAKAMEVIEVSKRVDPSRGETYHIGAEILLDLQHYDYVIPWAQYAWEQGTHLAAAILQPEGPQRRAAYMSPKLSSFTGYSSHKYLQAMWRYYEHVPAAELDAFIGPSPITDTRETTNG